MIDENIARQEIYQAIFKAQPRTAEDAVKAAAKRARALVVQDYERPGESLSNKEKKKILESLRVSLAPGNQFKLPFQSSKRAKKLVEQARNRKDKWRALEDFSKAQNIVFNRAIDMLSKINTELGPADPDYTEPKLTASLASWNIVPGSPFPVRGGSNRFMVPFDDIWVPRDYYDAAFDALGGKASSSKKGKELAAARADDAEDWFFSFDVMTGAESADLLALAGAKDAANIAEKLQEEPPAPVEPEDDDEPEPEDDDEEPTEEPAEKKRALWPWALAAGVVGAAMIKK